MNKCEKLKMNHAWEDTTPNVVYPTFPPQYPPKQDTCSNCKLVRTFHEKVERSISYSDGKERIMNPYNSMTYGDDLTNGTSISISGNSGTITSI